MPYACIFVPDFPVEAWLRVEPELRSQALAVLEGKAPLQKVCGVNDAAHRAGITPGMSKVQVEACSEYVLRARSELQEAAAHAALLDCAQSVSPRVEDTAPDTVVLDLAGLQSLFGSTAQIAYRLADLASSLGLQANVAVAGNPDTAALAARGFPGITVIPEQKEGESLAVLPVETLFDDGKFPDAEATLETFHRWGIRTLHDLAALPEVGLSERMGQQGIHWQKLARGETARTVVPIAPLLNFEEAIELDYPVLLLEPLAFLLSRMLEQICCRLEARALATQELKLELQLDNGAHQEIPWEEIGTYRRTKPQTSFQRTLRLPVPLLDPITFLKLLQLDLKAHPPGAPIVKIHLRAEPAKPRASQNGLFLPPSPEPERLELTLARIAGIVGEDKVGSLQLLDTHRPEGFRMQRFVLSEAIAPRRHGGIEKINQRSSIHKPSASPCLRGESSDNLVTALRMFRPPKKVAVTVNDGKPMHLSGTKKELCGDILWAAGPWRSSGDWWEQDGWSRDEWDIAVQGESGIALYRLVRDLLAGRWILEGTY